MPPIQSKKSLNKELTNLKSFRNTIIISIIGLSILAISTVEFSYLTSDPKIASILQSIFNGIGIGLISTVIIDVFFRLSSGRNFISEMNYEINEVISDYFSSVQRVNKYGLVDIHDKFPESRIYEVMSGSTKEIRILQTWIPEDQALRSFFKNTIINNGQVRILLLDPKSDFSQYRSEDLGHLSGDYVPRKVEITIDTLKAFYAKMKKEFPSKAKDNFQIKLYDRPYSFCLYSGDTHFFLGWYWNHELTSETPHLEVVNNQSLLCKMVSSHFETLWENGENVDLEK